ncbi:SAV1978 family virulence-associated passenger protein, partial [Staphylococcus aureus]
MPKTDCSCKDYLNQFFGTKRNLYQDNDRVAHILVVKCTSNFHVNYDPGWYSGKNTLD